MVPVLLPAQQLSLLQARESADLVPALDMSMRLDLGTQATEALESGLALGYQVRWQLADGRELSQSVTLRYSPLLRAYALSLGNAPAQTYALRNAMLAAFEQARLRFDEAAACASACGGRVRVALDRTRLPASLRLPSLLQPDWAFDSGWHEVQR